MDQTLGKRKQREEGDVLTHGSTLFVSNLPYTVTSVDLETLFSDIAPVRSAFIVTEPGTGVSKGVGYVAFALKEDAETAHTQLSKDGINLAGRKLRVQWANTKPKEKGDAAVKKESKPRPASRQPKLPHDPLAIRTIVVSGLPPAIDSKLLWKKIRKYTGAEKVDWPVKDDAGEEDPTTAHVLFTNPGLASDAVNKLHAHVYKGCLLSVTLKKRLDTLSKPVPKAKRTAITTDTEDPEVKVVVAAPSHASRLIVRNIPFNATEQDLRAIFLPYGPIYSVHIPLDEKATKKEDEAESSTAATTAVAYAAAHRPRTKGFAFVWMLSKKDAERAIEGCNGMVVRAGAAETLAQAKQKKKKIVRLEKKAAAKLARKKAEEEEDEVEEDEEKDEDIEKSTHDKRATERVIAVDWAMSKEKWKEEKAKIGDDVEMEDASGSDNSDDESDNDSEDEDEGLGVHNGGEGESGDNDSLNGDSDNDEEPVKPQLPLPVEGTTLFVRNIPFEATEDELRILFRSFGPLRYARITMDRETGRSRGTGFACFWNIEDADRAVQQSELLRSETTGQTVVPKKNPFQLPSILAPDPSSSLAQSLVLHGRTLDVVRAVTREDAGKLKFENERSREKADKRNMYLLREGVIMPNTPAAEHLTPAEVERRTSGFNARRALLKSSPSLFISKTRLSVRQIPIFVTERMLKRLTTHALKTFNAEVKQGTRLPLTKDELADPPASKPEEVAEPEKIEEGGEGEKKAKKKFTGRDTGVKQTKIVRQVERVDPVTGKGRSKGYGFVEMHRHSDALRFLRWANNNLEVGPLFESWWKDELEHLLKMERAKEEPERDDARTKRLKEEIENATQHKKTAKGSLIVEFSIENIQIVQRRDASQRNYDKPAVAGGSGNSTDRPPRRERQESSKGGEEPSSKKRRVSSKTEERKDEPVDSKPNPLGAIIGRKRKERKGVKKGGK